MELVQGKEVDYVEQKPLDPKQTPTTCSPSSSYKTSTTVGNGATTIIKKHLAIISD